MSEKPYGSGYFGEWIEDEFGLPAYRYTCDQILDPKAKTLVNEVWRNNTEHLHQVGNDRLVGVVSNYGHVQVRQDEGSPKFLNDYDPLHCQFGGGFGYLTGVTVILSTFYPGIAESFERIFGMGYYRKTVKGGGMLVDQIVFAPFGDDPLMISQVTVKNERSEAMDVRWIEYWGCQVYQFSYRSFMRSLSNKRPVPELRREFTKRFKHDITVVDENKGLLDEKTFKGRSFGDRIGWALLNLYLRTKGKHLTGGVVKSPVKEAVLEDIKPPTTFLISLDDPFDDYGTSATQFFGEGEAISPHGIQEPLSKSQSDDNELGMFLERRMHLEAGETKTIWFGYGYLPEGFQLEELIAKYETNLPDLLTQSSEQWKTNRIQLELQDEKWVDRELQWHNYYLRSNLTFDSFFKEHILSQGHVYQYLIGFQGAARDPLQHALPFVYTNPEIVKTVLRYTFKTVTPNGEIPYGIAGCGMYMPAPFRPSDQELWLLWLTSEYVLAARDLAFLDEEISTYPVYGSKAGRARVKDVLSKCYLHFVESTGIGKHGLQRLSNGDWNDNMVVGYVTEEHREVVEEQGESVLNAAMATYVLDLFSELLHFEGDTVFASYVTKYANAQRDAVREQWTGKWFKRAWLTDELGWVGDDEIWLEPQPWSIIGGAAESEQAETLVQSIDEGMRKPSKIGAMILAKINEQMVGAPGTGTNAGIWASINGTLIWALAKVNGSLAWDEWKKNSLAMHAEVYPDIWYGIWSGPDTLNSELSDYPGGTVITTVEKKDDEDEEKEMVDGLIIVNWTDYPVMNMHPHAWPLFTIAKLFGIEFTREGVDFAPVIPKEEYRFSSPLIEFEKTRNGYTGYYAPLIAGKWQITINLDEEELGRFSSLEVNGKSKNIVIEKSRLILNGEGNSDNPLKWALTY
jgi:hypothetical protein